MPGTQTKAEAIKCWWRKLWQEKNFTDTVRKKSYGWINDPTILREQTVRRKKKKKIFTTSFSLQIVMGQLSFNNYFGTDHSCHLREKHRWIASFPANSFHTSLCTLKLEGDVWLWKKNSSEKEPSVLLEPAILQHYTDLEVVGHAKMSFQLHRAGDTSSTSTVRQVTCLKPTWCSES